jgi:hypothetical protein
MPQAVPKADLWSTTLRRGWQVVVVEGCVACGEWLVWRTGMRASAIEVETGAIVHPLVVFARRELLS